MTLKSKFSDIKSSIPTSNDNSHSSLSLSQPPLSSTIITLPILDTATRFITAYGPKVKVMETFPADGRTKQSFKDECDINQIMARYQTTGVLDFVAKHQAQYGDCTGIEFQQGLDIIRQAREMFADLPSKLRARFSNDPGEFLDFVQDPANLEEAAQLGLLKPKAEEATPLAAPSTERGSRPPKPPQGALVGLEGDDIVDPTK